LSFVPPSLPPLHTPPSRRTTSSSGTSATVCCTAGNWISAQPSATDCWRSTRPGSESQAPTSQDAREDPLHGALQAGIKSVEGLGEHVKVFYRTVSALDWERFQREMEQHRTKQQQEEEEDKKPETATTSPDKSKSTTAVTPSSAKSRLQSRPGKENGQKSIATVRKNGWRGRTK
jgi:hypothetical protein